MKKVTVAQLADTYFEARLDPHGPVGIGESPEEAHQMLVSMVPEAEGLSREIREDPFLSE